MLYGVLFGLGIICLEKRGQNCVWEKSPCGIKSVPDLRYTHLHSPITITSHSPSHFSTDTRTATEPCFLTLLSSLSCLCPTRPPLTVSAVRCRCCNTCPAISILDWRMQLNNFLEVNGGTTRLQYVDVPSGPVHKLTWHCTIYSEFNVPRLWYSLLHLLS